MYLLGQICAIDMPLAGFWISLSSTSVMLTTQVTS